MRHSTRPRRNFRVRLACVKHAASVQSEPESNSPVQICCKDSRWTEIRISKFFPLALHLSKNRAPLSGARSTSTLPQAACQLLFSLSGKFFPNLPSGAEASPPPRNFLLEKSPAPCQELFPGTSGKSPAPAPGGNPFGSRSRPAKAISTQSPTKRQAFLQKNIFLPETPRPTPQPRRSRPFRYLSKYGLPYFFGVSSPVTPQGQHYSTPRPTHAQSAAYP